MYFFSHIKTQESKFDFAIETVNPRSSFEQSWYLNNLGSTQVPDATSFKTISLLVLENIFKVLPNVGKAAMMVV